MWRSHSYVLRFLCFLFAVSDSDSVSDSVSVAVSDYDSVSVKGAVAVSVKGAVAVSVKGAVAPGFLRQKPACVGSTRTVQGDFIYKPIALLPSTTLHISKPAKWQR